MNEVASLSLHATTPIGFFLPKRTISPSLPRASLHFVSRRSKRPGIRALLGNEGKEDKKPEKKFITKEEEPEQYWQTAGEREGESPMKTPLPYIIIFGMSTPFVILAIAFANGWIKVPVR